MVSKISRAKNNEYENKIIRLVSKFNHCLIYSTLVTILCIILGSIIYFQYNYYNKREKELASYYKNQITEMINVQNTMSIQNFNLLENRLKEKNDEMINVTNNYREVSKKLFRSEITNMKLLNISKELDESNQILLETNNNYYEELCEFKEREELYNKYEYALYEDNKRTDITFDHIKTLSELLKDEKVNDTDLFLAWIMTESSGKENCKNPESTAKGFGQFLDGTSKWVYCDMMNNSISSWSPSVALDGYTNLEMMVTFVNYLYDTTGENLVETIRRYRGKRDITSYVARIDRYLKSTGKTVSLISKSLK